MSVEQPTNFVSKSLSDQRNLDHFEQDVIGRPGGSQFARIMDDIHGLVENEEDPLSMVFFVGMKSVPYATAAKYFWRTAYPDTPKPPFALLDASIGKHGEGHTSFDAVGAAVAVQNQRLAQLGGRHGHNNIALFDEIVISGNSLRRASTLLRGQGFTNIHPFGLHIMSDGIHTRSIEHTVHRRPAPDSYSWAVSPFRDNARALLEDMKTVGQMAAHNALQS